LDAKDNLYIWGRYAKLENAPDLPMKNAAQANRGGHVDAFLAKFDPEHNLLYSTFLGGSQFDSIVNFVLGEDGYAYALGVTYSTDFHVKGAFQEKYGGGQSDLFIAKLTPGGSLVYASYLGASAVDDISNHLEDAIVVDSKGNAYIGGRTSSEDFPVKKAWQDLHGGGRDDGFVVKLGPNGELIYSTYLGGRGDDGVVRLFLRGEGSLKVRGYSIPSGEKTGIAFEVEIDPDGLIVDAPQFAN